MEEQNKSNRRHFGKGLITGIILTSFVLITFFVCFYLHEMRQYERTIKELAGIKTLQETNYGELIDENFVQKAELIYNRVIKEFYYDSDIKPVEMQDLMYKAMILSLNDRYAEYYTKEEFDELTQESDGSYYGIGSYVTMDQELGYPVLSGVFKGSPASEAGLRDGDIIAKVNGEDIGGLTLTEAVNLIKGPENTTVDLSIVRDGEKDFLEFTVERRQVETPTVNHEMKSDKVGYLQITEFDDVTAGQFSQAYADLYENGMEAMIIDLRSNGGGNLDTVLSIAGEMLPGKLITYTVDRNGHKDEYKGKGKDEITIPLVVLTNGYTASASELLTGALKSYGKATIIGTNTFGKGVVQSIYPFSDGTGIKITTSKYYTPDDVCVNEIGIAPDIELEFDGERYYSAEAYDNQLEYAIEYLKSNLK